jgi:hypothetical protein
MLYLTALKFFWQICWYLAAVVQVQLCKYFIEIGDTEREATVWGEINVLRFVTSEKLCFVSDIKLLDLQCWSTEIGRLLVVSMLWCVIFLPSDPIICSSTRATPPRSNEGDCPNDSAKAAT